MVASRPHAPEGAWHDRDYIRVSSTDDPLRTLQIGALLIVLIGSTRGLFGAAQLSQVKRSVIRINPSRCGIVCKPALIQVGS